MPDPLLTPLGKEQCANFAAAFPRSHPTTRITHLVASPLRRTLYTALYAFPADVARGVRVLALPLLQETSGLPCDTGSAPATLAAEFAPDPSISPAAAAAAAAVVDLTHVTPGWNVKEGRWSPAASAIEARAREARQFLRRLGREALAAKSTSTSTTTTTTTTHPDIEIAVVTHGGYLHYFTEDWDDHGRFTGTGWANTETRSYEFVNDTDNASLQETQASRALRRGREIPLTPDEQRELRASAERQWRECGFQLEEAKL